MNKNVEKEFSEMVANLLQTEFCEDWNPKLLHGFMGISSEAGELLNKYKNSMEIDGKPFDRTDTLIELSDLLHYTQMIIGVLESSVEEIMHIDINCLERPFHDEVAMSYCEHLDPILFRGLVGCASGGGELLNRYKKFMYYHGEPFTRYEIFEGLARLLHYMQMIIDRLDSSVEEVMCINMAKLKTRYPNGYAHDKAITHLRDKEAERAAINAVIDTFAAMREREDLGE